MPNTKYIRGRNTEYKAMKDLEAEGYSCIRASGSHGVFDVIAWKVDCVKFIQCKREAAKKTKKGTRRWLVDEPLPDDKMFWPYEEDLADIRFQKVPAHCHKELWIWRDRQGWIRKRVE